jgi:hypothetical protein
MSLSWLRLGSLRGLIEMFKVPVSGNDGGIIGKPVPLSEGMPALPPQR